MKYVKEFINYLSYIKFKNSNNYIEPNVSLCTSENKTYYNKYHIHDYSQDYLTFIALEDAEFSFNFLGTKDYGGYYVTQNMRENIAYSLDNGETWVELVNTGELLSGVSLTTPTIHKDETVLWKGIGYNNRKPAPIGGQWGCSCYFSSTGNYNIEGNILSIVYGDNFKNQTSLAETQDVLCAIFRSNSKLVNAKNLVLPITTLGENCYEGMFEQCTSLVSTPKLPATTLTKDCYLQMFRSCSSLTTAPELPATTLAQGCYDNMFSSCSSLTTAPELPATTLAQGCYKSMFINCTNLNSITCLATDISASSCTDNWVNGVAATGTFTKAASMTNWTTGTSGIPTGWTVQDSI